MAYYSSPRWTNEIADCSMPMTFDTYSNCSFGCLYCFAQFQRGIGGAKESYLHKDVKNVSVDKIKRMFTDPDKYAGQFAPYIKARKVMQWGGMSDEFDGFEKQRGKTLELMRFFKEIDYPLCFSTKAAWFTDDDRYMSLIEGQKNWNFKFSIITLDEAKAKRIFQSRQGRIKIISKIAADLNSASVVMPSDLMDYCGNLFNEVLYLLRTCESSNFTYDQTLDLFIVGDDALQDRTTAFVESLPAMFTINELASSLQKAAEDFDLPEEVAKKAISEVFKLTGDVYHRNRLSRAVIFQEILSEYFQDGIHIHNPEEIALFRDLVHKNYGDVNLSRNDRALAARIADICILCDRGKYRLIATAQ